MRFASTAVLLALGGLLFAAPSRAGDDFKLEPGFTSLFNGKDLTGWRYYKEKLDGKTATADQRFTVVDGIIVANEGKGIKDLYTQQDFAKDFQLKLEFRAALKADSGLYVRGPQLQVRDFIRRKEHLHLKKFLNDGWNELDVTVRAGQLDAVANGKKLTAKDSLEVTVKDGKSAATLNGKSIDVNNIQVSVGNIAHCLCNGEFLEDMKVPAKGGIGLQAETGKFEFRRIRLKQLP
jgi:3-keto-disaccharide hydrolase